MGARWFTLPGTASAYMDVARMAIRRTKRVENLVKWFIRAIITEDKDGVYPPDNPARFDLTIALKIIFRYETMPIRSGYASACRSYALCRNSK